MKTKHSYKYACNLLQKNKIRAEKKSDFSSEVKLTEKLNKKTLIVKSYTRPPYRRTKQTFNCKFLMRIIPTNIYRAKIWYQ